MNNLMWYKHGGSDGFGISNCRCSNQETTRMFLLSPKDYLDERIAYLFMLVLPNVNGVWLYPKLFYWGQNLVETTPH
jgi:hypothetical protein